MQPQIINKPAFTVVGMQIRTTPMNPEIPHLWDHFGPRIDEVANIAEAYVSYGLMGNYAENMASFDYMAGVSVTSVGALPAGMTTWDVPAYTYAVFDATIPTMGEVFDYIYNSWLAASGYHQTVSLTFERYGEDFNPHDPNSAVNIYIPVEKVG